MTGLKAAPRNKGFDHNRHETRLELCESMLGECVEIVKDQKDLLQNCEDALVKHKELGDRQGELIDAYREDLDNCKKTSGTLMKTNAGSILLFLLLLLL